MRSVSNLNRLPFHPILFGALAVISPLATNIEEVSPRTVLRPLAMAIAAVVVLLILLRFKNLPIGRAALVASLILIFFTLYGHVFRLLAPD